MDCLRGLVKVRQCSQEGETPGQVYINSLPGVSLESLEKIAGADKYGYLDLWADIESRALRRIEVDLSVKLKKRYKLKTILQSISLGKNIKTLATPIGDSWVGVVLKKNNTCCSSCTDLTYFHVSTISLYLDEERDLIAKIYDLTTSQILWEKTIPASYTTIGWNVVTVENSFFSDSLFLAFLVYDGWNKSMQIETKDYCNCNYVTIKGGISNSSLPYEVTQTKDSFGVSATFSLRCGYHSTICNSKDILSFPLLYLLGYEVLTERIASDRVNKWTLLNLQEAKELREYFYSEYDKKLSEVTEGITFDPSNVCLECGGVYQIVEAKLWN